MPQSTGGGVTSTTDKHPSSRCTTARKDIRKGRWGTQPAEGLYLPKRAAALRTAAPDPQPPAANPRASTQYVETPPPARLPLARYRAPGVYREHAHTALPSSRPLACCAEEGLRSARGQAYAVRREWRR